MSNSQNTWPLPNIPVKDARVVLATQGVRIWTAECRIESFDETLQIACNDRTTIDNLRHQQRVAFTILDSTPDGIVQGSGIAHVPDTQGSKGETITVEPYRVSAGGLTYELRLNGWTRVTETELPDISRYSFWYQAFRLVTLPLSALPVLAGGAAAFALGQFNLLLLALSFISAVSAHAGANATADYFDFKKGVDRSQALSSHLGALARERVEPEMILLAAFLCFLLTAIAGLVLVEMVGWGLLPFGLAGLLGAFFYTGRPVSYKYRAMGELWLGVLMGPVIVMGSYYTQARSWDWSVFLVSAALGMLVSSVSLANNLRDLPDDRVAGIRTLPMALGVSKIKKLYYTLTWAPFIVSLAAVLINHSLWPVAIVLISLPKAVKTIQALRTTTDDIQDIRKKSLQSPYPLNSIRLHAQFGALAVAGLALAGLLRLIA